MVSIRSGKGEKFEIKTKSLEVLTSRVEDPFHTRLWNSRRGVARMVVCPLCGVSGILCDDRSAGKHLVAPDGKECTANFDPSTGNCWLSMKDVPRAVARKLRGVNG